MIIRGNTVGTTTPRSNWNQNDPKKVDYIIGKDVVDAAIAAAQTTADGAVTASGNAKTAADNAQSTANTAKSNAATAQTTADNHAANKKNPHGVTAAQVGAVTESQVNTMINNALGVIENGTY